MENSIQVKLNRNLNDNLEIKGYDIAIVYWLKEFKKLE